MGRHRTAGRFEVMLIEKIRETVSEEERYWPLM
jgi:hypothetical protein